MKIFISYRFSGEDTKVLEETMGNICNSLKETEYEFFCSFWKESYFKENNYTLKEILEYALDELDSSDICLAFIKSQDKSEGMLLEIGYALAKGKKIYLAIQKDVKTGFLREIAEKVIEYDTLEDLYEKLKTP